MPSFSSYSGKFLSSSIGLLFTTLWICNDHFWKCQFSNELTGKLSDITGLIVFPFLLTNLGSFSFQFIFQRKIREEIVFFIMNLNVTILFFIINWNQDWNNWIYTLLFGNQNGTADKTDLLCVPFCILANFYFYKKYSKQEKSISKRKKLLHVMAIILSSLAFINTSRIDEHIINSERNIFHPILIARPTNGETYKIKEEEFFIWYTEGNFKEFQIYIFPTNENEMQNHLKISISSSQLEQHLDSRINKHFFVYSTVLSLPKGNYRLAVAGNMNEKSNKINPLEFYKIINENLCYTLKFSCSELINLGIEK